MMLCCGPKCVKRVLIVFNMILWLCGFILIAFGCHFRMREDKNVDLSLLDRGWFEARDRFNFITIVCGLHIFIIASCCFLYARSDIHEEDKKKVLVWSSILTLFIIGIYLAVCGLVIQEFFYKTVYKEAHDLEEKFSETLKSKYGLYQNITLAIDFLQTKFECCGVRNGSDFLDSIWKRNVTDNDQSVSPTCCKLRNAGQPGAYLYPQPLNESLCQRDDSTNSSYRHQEGCLRILEEYMIYESSLFFGTYVILAALVILGMIFSIGLRVIFSPYFYSRLTGVSKTRSHG